MNDRILFLDIDGVLLTQRAALGMGRDVPLSGHLENLGDPVAIGLIQRCCEAGARIVVTSSWRKLQENCRAILARCELLPYIHEHWRTRDDNYKDGDCRGAQIHEWLEIHPSVRSYRIVDDDTAMLPSQRPYFVCCDRHDGLDYSGMQNLLAWSGIHIRPRT